MDSETIGVERRRLPFTIVENIVLEDQALGPVDVLVYIALAKHADAEGVCWPSMATIARLARVGRSKAFEAIKHLEARGYLTRNARFRPDGGVTSNVYRLTPSLARPVLNARRDGRARQRDITRRVYSERLFPPMLRHVIFERDNFTCQVCGKTRETLAFEGSHLEVDHVKEWEDGGLTCYDNGRTICADCNKGRHGAKRASSRQSGVRKNQ